MEKFPRKSGETKEGNESLKKKNPRSMPHLLGRKAGKTLKKRNELRMAMVVHFAAKPLEEVVRAKLIRAKFVKASLVRAKLVRAKFIKASFVRVKLVRAKFVKASFVSAKYGIASFVWAQLVRAKSSQL